MVSGYLAPNIHGRSATNPLHPITPRAVLTAVQMPDLSNNIAKASELESIARSFRTVNEDMPRA